MNKIEGEFEKNYKKSKDSKIEIGILAILLGFAFWTFLWATLSSHEIGYTLGLFFLFFISVSLGAVTMEYLNSMKIISDPYYASALAQKERKKRLLGKARFPKQ